MLIIYMRHVDVKKIMSEALVILLIYIVSYLLN